MRVSIARASVAKLTAEVRAMREMLFCQGPVIIAVSGSPDRLGPDDAMTGLACYHRAQSKSVEAFHARLIMIALNAGAKAVIVGATSGGGDGGGLDVVVPRRPSGVMVSYPEAEPVEPVALPKAA
jgi:hypothetical protein